jgi:ATPase subunit of ABC transporter with duplicated ATPase domains
MPAFVTLDRIAAKTPDGRPLFENLTLAFGRERTGLVGRNGVGKTTLLRLIAGEQPPAEGEIARTGTLGVLAQAHAPPPGASLADLLGVAEPLARLARIERGEGNEDDFVEADWELPERIAAALAEVGLAGDLDGPAAALSGGQATRAALAGLLIAQPDLLLLDEPTNNLDREGRGLIAEVIGRWKGGAVVVSHDRELLNRMDRIVELSSLGARVYGGNYEAYAARRAEERAAAGRDLAAAQRAARRTETAVQAAAERQARRDAAGRRSRIGSSDPKILLDFRAERAEATAGRGAQLAARRREAAADQLHAAEAQVERLRSLAFDLPPSGLPAGRGVLEFEAVSFAYGGGAPVLQGLSFRIAGPERAALVGPNGAGKSTVLKLGIGELEPTSGLITRGVRAAVLDQRASLLADDETLLENFRRLNPEADANAGHAALARFLFRNVDALKLAGALSGGERLRAALACVLMAARPPQLLILDEPTNHLDLESIAAIESALAGYDGALLVVSHDTAFLEAIEIEREILLPQGGEGPRRSGLA